MLVSQSPNAFHRARTLTRVLDQSSFCTSQPESNQLTFEGLRNQLRFVPTIAQKNSTIAHVKSPSLSKITASTPSTSKSGTLKSIARAPSISNSPLRQRSSILSRKNTLDMQIGQLSPLRPSPLSLSKELSSPRDFRRDSPTIMTRTPSKSKGSVSSLKVSSIVKKQGLAKQGSFGLPFNKVVMTLPDQEYPELSRLDTKMSTNDNSGALSSRRVRFTDEEDKVADKIMNDGIISFKEILKKHCRYRSTHLVEPVEKCEVVRNFSPKAKSIIQKKPLQNVQNIDVNHDYMGFSFLAKGSASVPNAALIKQSQQLERMLTLGDRRSNEEDQLKQKARKLDPIANEKKIKESEERLRLNDVDNLMKMMELSEALKPERPLTLFEKEFLNLIKDGGDIKKIRELVIKNRELVNISDNRRQTPLHWAVKKDRMDVVEVLCDFGVELNTHDMALRTPMDIAKRLGNKKMIKFLKDYASQCRVI